MPQLSESMFANGADCVIPSGLALSAKHDAIFSKGGQVDKSEADTNDWSHAVYPHAAYPISLSDVECRSK